MDGQNNGQNLPIVNFKPKTIRTPLENLFYQAASLIFGQTGASLYPIFMNQPTVFKQQIDLLWENSGAGKTLESTFQVCARQAAFLQLAYVIKDNNNLVDLWLQAAIAANDSEIFYRTKRTTIKSR